MIQTLILRNLNTRQRKIKTVILQRQLVKGTKNIHLVSLSTLTTIQPKRPSGLGALALAGMPQKPYLYWLTDWQKPARNNCTSEKAVPNLLSCIFFFFF